MLGGAGVSNFGDELMVRKWLDFYLQNGMLDKVVVDGSNKRVLSDLFSDKYKGVRYNSAFNSLRGNGPKDFWQSLKRGLNFFDNGGFSNYPQHKAWAKEIEKVKVLHLHGGGYLNNIWPQAAFLLGVAAATKERYNCKLVATGIGFLPVNKPNGEAVEDLRRVINCFDFFECRDYPSMQFITNAIDDKQKVFYGLDDTFIGSLEKPSDASIRTLHLSYFPHVKKFIDDALERTPITAFDQFDEILFWACASHDLECLPALKGKFPNIKTVQMKDLVMKPLPVRRGDVMVTARFHPHLLAARMGSTGLYKKDESYYDIKQGSVIDLGSPFMDLKRYDLSNNYIKYGFNRMESYENDRVNMKQKLGKHIVDLYKDS
ncbi:polysaccharide pyruvyl transferase family protein [Paenochrobactrum sp. BZR 201-1]